MKKMTKLEALTLTDDKLDKAVRILGTDYDRKRKFTTADVKKMLTMLKKNKTVAEIAEAFNTSIHVVNYNTNPTYRQLFNENRKGKYQNRSKGKITIRNRVAYKRTLVAEGKLTAMALA